MYQPVNHWSVEDLSSESLVRGHKIHDVFVAVLSDHLLCCECLTFRWKISDSGASIPGGGAATSNVGWANSDQAVCIETVFIENKHTNVNVLVRRPTDMMTWKTHLTYTTEY